MKQKIETLKKQLTERANYFTGIEFPNLATEFTELVNILNYAENLINEYEIRIAQIDNIKEDNTNGNEML